MGQNQQVWCGQTKSDNFLCEICTRSFLRGRWKRFKQSTGWRDDNWNFREMCYSIGLVDINRAIGMNKRIHVRGTSICTDHVEVRREVNSITSTCGSYKIWNWQGRQLLLNKRAKPLIQVHFQHSHLKGKKCEPDDAVDRRVNWDNSLNLQNQKT